MDSLDFLSCVLRRKMQRCDRRTLQALSLLGLVEVFSHRNDTFWGLFLLLVLDASTRFVDVCGRGLLPLFIDAVPIVVAGARIARCVDVSDIRAICGAGSRGAVELVGIRDFLTRDLLGRWRPEER